MQQQLIIFPQLLTSWILHVSIAIIILLLENNATMQGTPCDKSRQVFNSTWGIITDGPLGSNYTKDSHCEWLIRARSDKEFITLTFQTMGTECSFDYVFVYDGESFNSPLLGSFSGKTEPQQITATSGSMLILLYSDTNYVLGGFEAQFSVTDCPRNCSKHGECIFNSCKCEKDWGGEDCSIQLCPNSCGADQGRGTCIDGHCHCTLGYSGQSCSLHFNSSTDNSWHWLSNNEVGLTPRAAHTAIYDKKTDSLYVYGGYDLNNILEDLSIYRFSTSRWEDENGFALDKIQIDEDQLVGNNTSLWKEHLYNSNTTNYSNFGIPDNVLENLLKYPNSYSDRISDYEDVFLNLTNVPKENSQNQKPPSRYGHAACKCEDGFVIFGGKLMDGSLSNELWFYNVSSKLWRLRARMSELHPPPLTRHSLTLVDNDTFYLFGGSTSNGEFSSKLYYIRLNFLNENKEQWKLVRPRGGKELDLRLVAHTTVYHKRSNSLLVYGGVMADVARFSRLSDRMFLFKLSDRHWSEIYYPRAHLPDTYVPRERAFHTSNILGNYLVVFGGYTHRHNKEEICYDNQMYLYHLGCHTWVSHDILGLSDSGFRYKKLQGVFAHAADVRNGNTLLIFGGYHGNMNADLWAYVLPSTLTSRDGEVFEPEHICSRHHSLHECTSNPECGWCSADEVCYGRTVGVNCTTNLQTTRCPGICPALGDCHSCLIHGEMNFVPHTSPKSVVHKLRLGQCIWCVQNARCHHKDDNYGVCGLREDTPSQSPGWWGLQGTEVYSVEECRIKDRRPGLTFIKYNHPVNWSQPDSVSIINATTADFDVSTKETRSESVASGGVIIARLLGFLRIPEDWVNITETLKMCTSFSSTILRLGHDHLATSLELVGNVTAETSSCQFALWPSGKFVTLHPGRYLVDFESKKSITSGSNSYQQSKMALMHNKGRENSKTFTFEYLEPYQNGSCHVYTNCLHCLTDSSCGWCDLTKKCYSRDVNETEICRINGSDDWHYLTLQPSHCENCSNFISCENCVNSNLCEWWVEEARCFRRGFSSSNTVNASDFCPMSCYERRNCSQCLDDRGLCVWCEATQECFSFSVYTSEYQFGICREWIDKSHETGFQTNNYHINGIAETGGDRCKSCAKHSNCSSCLHSLSCGWCYEVNNPIIGVCVSGNFKQPQDDSCVYALAEAFNKTVPPENIGWSYAQCPDVNECLLKLDNCHQEAICTNTDGSFTCECKRGFYGDGRHSCMKTCYNKCINGVCTMAPDYRCQCDLGWTGDDCGIDCGCNNHSTCNKSVGVCDECQDWTIGSFCEYCKTGSYGNATSKEGCRKCECNEHGDESLGLCDSATGICFCQHNTEGDQCEKCSKGYYGSPKNGGICYYQCAARGMVTTLGSQGIGSHREDLMPWESRLGSIAKECLWILNSSTLTNGTSQTSVIQLNIDNDININCQNNGVFIFEGLPDLAGGSSGHQNHALGTFCQRDDAAPLMIESKSGTMTVLFKQGDDSEGFNASFSIFSCPNNCRPNRTCVGSECVCSSGWTGPNCSLPVCPQNCSFHVKQGYCDKGYERCICRPGYGGLDCSLKVRQDQLVFTELFNSAKLSHSFDHLRKMIPRFGHSLVTDRRGSLWMFGGYSLSHGPLNDIRLFDTKNNTWMQVTVDSTRDAAMPQGRYFHAAEIVQSRREIFIYGGICAKENPSGFANNTLRDFWKFSLKHQRWIDIEIYGSPPPLAGHTLTLMKDLEKENLVLVGGFSPEYGFLNTVWNFNLETEVWSTIVTSGNRPIDICGHTNVYHSPTKSFYLFGGYMFYQNRTIYSNKLYSFHYPSLKWSLLPTFEEYNPLSSNLPQARFLHSAITTKDYMLVFGGRMPHNKEHFVEQSDFLIAYSYSCNQWIRLLSRGTHVVGSPPPLTYGQAMTYDAETGSVYVVGGFNNQIQSHVTRINLPSDLCNLWSGKEKCRSFLGCSFCSIMRPDKSLTSICYSSQKSSKESCDYYNGTLITNNGVVCDGKWFEQRSCDQFKTCSVCLAKWPTYMNERPICKWCNNCVRSKCIPYNQTCGQDKKCQSVSNADDCKDFSCTASNCEKCRELKSCSWKGQSCVRAPSEESMLMPCPSRCYDFKDCASCLSSNCRWSTSLKECISSDYQPLYCAGGVCGLVLKEGRLDLCPAPCSSYTQCSTCLKNSHCGWCSVKKDKTTGVGICTEGSLPRPQDASSCQTLLPTEQRDSINWNYVICPEENECENNHHTCNRISEECIDLTDGFRCDCGPGFKSVNSQCEPVCTQGCVRGVCIAPNNCSCDFGYVGANCSIQCQCNGHSNCAGPDKLDTCLECHNNTKGAQCDKCKPLFVGNPTNNGHCVPCYEYCNEHTHICINDSLSGSVLLNKSMSELSALLEEGPMSNALCIGCVNKTTGRRCDECMEGYFRGTEDLRQKCRPCECHGHGDRCDPVTGEKCNCANNTESECQTSISKNSNQQCWMLQCSKCKESYSGTPTDGHQCYKQMTLDHKFCLDSKLIEDCELKPRPLYPGQSVFFQVQPRYVNVDIRVILDVTQGSLDLYMSPKDDSLIVFMNASTGRHSLNWDPKYKHKTILPQGGPYSSVHLPVVDVLIPSRGGHKINSTSHTHPDVFLGIEQEAEGLTTYITVNRNNTFLHVKNICDRLIITLPKDKFDLISTRFYLALTALPKGQSSEPSFGILFFRQDQLHIDLFVFFSVFFSCFFLFLSGCVVAWKAKQAADVRRARRRHVVEMLHMAKRPFAGIILHLDGEESEESTNFFSQSPHRKKRTKPTAASRELRPVAIEPTDDGIAAIATVFVRLPGGADAPVQLSLASSLIMMSRVYPLNSRAFLRRRSSHHGPV